MTPVENREQLVALLTEAAEIEHCLMCSYLYAIFSLKRAGDGLEPTQQAAVDRWRASMYTVAKDEMLHLALVSNMLVAVGARPHYRRPNFPVDAGRFPAEVVVRLRRFDRATLDHFVYLERPADADDPDGEGYADAADDYAREPSRRRLMPMPGDYETIGELYDGIEASFERLASSLGAGLWAGRASRAAWTAADVGFDGLRPVRTLPDARRAIRLIVDQGEGARLCDPACHYARFRAIREEWQSIAAGDAGFDPARPAAADPVMRRPVVDEPRLQVIAEPAASLLDAGNAAYGLMTRMLAAHGDESMPAAQRALATEHVVALMGIVAAIGERLPDFEAHPDHPGVHAGLTFSVSPVELAFQSRAQGPLMSERLAGLAVRLEQLVAVAPDLAAAAHRCREAALAWGGPLGSRRIASA